MSTSSALVLRELWRLQLQLLITIAVTTSSVSCSTVEPPISTESVTEVPPTAWATTEPEAREIYDTTPSDNQTTSTTTETTTEVETTEETTRNQTTRCTYNACVLGFGRGTECDWNYYIDIVSQTVESCFVENDFCLPTVNGEQPCLNNGTCYNDVNHFKCICRRQPLLPSQRIVGLRCDQIVSAISIPTITALSVRRGILAGGARITLSGSSLSVYPPLGAFFNGSALNQLYGYVLPNSTTPTSTVIVSPPATLQYVGVPLQLKADYSGPSLTAPNLYFSYTDNPRIINLLPRSQLISGGVLMTVIGSSLDVVQGPIMVVTLEISIYRISEIDNTTSLVVKSYLYTSNCRENGSDSMVCLMPTFDQLTSDFVRNEENVNNQSAVATIVSNTTGSVARMYIGFVLDNFPNYKNTTESNPDIRINLIPISVTFDLVTPYATFNPSSDTHLTITGKKFSRGCSINDYDVKVGVGSCRVDAFTDDLITCRPPTVKPDQNLNGSLYCVDADLISLMINIGKSGVSATTFFVYCVKYVSNPLPVALIVGITVGIGSLVIIVTVVVVVVVKCRKQLLSGKPVTTRGRNDSFEMTPTSGFSPIDDDYQYTRSLTSSVDADQDLRRSLKLESHATFGKHGRGGDALDYDDGLDEPAAAAGSEGLWEEPDNSNSDSRADYRESEIDKGTATGFFRPGLDNKRRNVDRAAKVKSLYPTEPHHTASVEARSDAAAEDGHNGTTDPGAAAATNSTAIIHRSDNVKSLFPIFDF